MLIVMQLLAVSSMANLLFNVFLCFWCCCHIIDNWLKGNCINWFIFGFDFFIVIIILINRSSGCRFWLGCGDCCCRRCCCWCGRRRTWYFVGFLRCGCGRWCICRCFSGCGCGVCSCWPAVCCWLNWPVRGLNNRRIGCHYDLLWLMG